MGTRLYVGNLPFEATEEDIISLLSRAGSVKSCELIMDKFSNRSRGFAFVEMSSQEEADRVVQQFNGQDFQGRKLMVNEAKPRDNRQGGGRY